MVSSSRQRRVQGYNVTLQSLGQRHKLLCVLFFSVLPGRITELYRKIEPLQHSGQLTTDIAHPDNSYRQGRPVFNTPLFCVQGQYREHILSHTDGIAAWRSGETDALFLEPGLVYVVRSNRGRANEPHPGTLQQLPVYPGYRTDQKYIGIPYLVRSQRPAIHPANLSDVAKKGIQ